MKLYSEMPFSSIFLLIRIIKYSQIRLLYNNCYLKNFHYFELLIFTRKINKLT